MSDELKKKGNEAFANQKYDDAIKFFTEAIQVDEKNHILYSNRSAAFAAKGLYQEALKDAEKCIELNPQFIKGYSRKATALRYLNDHEGAFNAYQEGLKIDKNNQMLLDGLKELQEEMRDSTMQAFANIFSGDVWGKLNANESTKDFKNDPEFVKKIEMIQQNPQLAAQFMTDKKVMSAVAVLLGLDFKPEQNDAPANEPKSEPTPAPKAEEPKKEEAPKEEPKPKVSEFPEADKEKELGNAEYKKKNFEAALAHYEKAIELAPKVLVYSSNKAAVLIEMKRFDETLELCEKCISQAKEERNYDMLAKFLSRQGTAFQGKKEYEKAIAAFQSSLTEVRCAATLNKLRQCESEYEKFKAAEYENPEIAEQERLKGNEFFKQNNFPEAMKCYNEAIKRAPRQASLYSNRSATYINLLEFQLALKDAEKCIELDPKFVRGYSRKGTAHFYLKEYVKALEAYQEGLKIDPNNEECERGIQNVETQIRHQQASGKVDEQQIQRALADPEIQAIMRDPVITNVITDMTQHPENIQKHLSNPEIASKIEKLIASGILRTSAAPQ